MKVCLNCKTDNTSRWRGDLCNSCYARSWRAENVEHVKNYNETIDCRFNRAKQKAKWRNLEWLISFSEFSEMCDSPCYYCNNLIGKMVTQGSGLDRINNDVGYIVGNVVSCCGNCNLIRNDILSHEEMIAVAKLICQLRNI